MKRLVMFVLLLPLASCICSDTSVTDGTHITLGVHAPGSSGAVSFRIFSYLNGFHINAGDASELELSYTVSETNSVFGVFNSEIHKKVRAKVTCPPADAALQVTNSTSIR